MFRSLEKKIKPFEPHKTVQEPEVRHAAEAALFCITAHNRLPSDSFRQAYLEKNLRKWGFFYAADVLRHTQTQTITSQMRLQRRDWMGLDTIYPLKAALQKADNSTLARLALTHAESLSGASGIWALELARRGNPGNLDCRAWMKIAHSTQMTHSEQALSALWPLLQQVCKPTELAQPIQTKEATPEWIRLYEAQASFSDRIRLCTTLGIHLNANLLRNEFQRQKSINLLDVALGFLCSGDTFLEFEAKTIEEHALRLHFSGKTQEALEYLEQQRPENNFSGRMRAARLALHFGDIQAAIGHLRWAAAFAQHPIKRAAAFAQLEILLRMQDEETWTLLQERFRLDPKHTARELWLSGHWPAIVRLSGQAPLLWKEEAKEALQHFVDCNPQEMPDSRNPLITYWRHLMGLEELRQVWPSAKPPTQACPTPLGATQSTTSTLPPTPPSLWQGDFASDLAHLLARHFPATAWADFFMRHVHDPRIITAAELEVLLYPHSFEHARTSATVFAWKNDPQRAVTLLEDAVRKEVEPANSWKQAAQTMLNAGYRHLAVQFMRLRHEWLTAFASHVETRRFDLRLQVAAETIHFLFLAGFTTEARQRLTTVLEDARRFAPFHGARTSEWLALRYPSWFTTQWLLQLTENPLFFLEWAVMHTDARRYAAHILEQLQFVLPNAPETFWLACALLEDEATCLKAHTRGIDGEIHLELALHLLDKLQKFSTVSRPADERLALHAARRRANAHPAWWFVFTQLTAQPQ